MKKLNLCIDIDGTVTEPFYWLARANRYFGKAVRPSDVVDYEIHKVMGIDPKSYDEFYRKYCNNLHLEALIRPDVKDSMDALAKRHNIHFVTAREEKLRDVSMEWMRKYRIPLDSMALLGTSDKTHEAKKLECDLFIEDCYDNAMLLANAGFDVCLINYRYNQGKLPSNVRRVHNWKQIEHIVQIKQQEIPQIITDPWSAA